MAYDLSKPLPDPRIGILMREGGPVFYACIDGQFPERATPEEVLDLLEGREGAVEKTVDFERATTRTKDYEITYSGKTAKALADFEVYIVTVDALDIVGRPGETRVLAPSGPAAIRAMKEYVKREMIFSRFDGRIVYSVKPAND
ncbi:hypothetical protein [Rhizobium leguminosarum]|uniref:hypothetical protein n=1 Tax=Rhizobium leguminosarum TaxID=384 RepID=UPI002E0DFA9A|nr:hypothetical protein U8Q02_41205 [Rhizobium leguminosarum]